jgi:hypothetical protein
MPLMARARLAALVAGGLICAGCQGEVTTTTKPYAPEPVPTEAPNSPSPAAPARAAAPARPRVGLPSPLDLTLEKVNEYGVKVKIKRITFRSNEILVDLVAVNTSPNPVTLAGSPFTGMTLTDDKGTSYDFQAPKQNPALKVAPGRTYEGRVTFLGTLRNDASLLVLTTNAGSNGDRYVPRFEFANIAIAPS